MCQDDATRLQAQIQQESRDHDPRGRKQAMKSAKPCKDSSVTGLWMEPADQKAEASPGWELEHFYHK